MVGWVIKLQAKNYGQGADPQNERTHNNNNNNVKANKDDDDKINESCGPF